MKQTLLRMNLGFLSLWQFTAYALSTKGILSTTGAALTLNAVCFVMVQLAHVTLSFADSCQPSSSYVQVTCAPCNREVAIFAEGEIV